MDAEFRKMIEELWEKNFPNMQGSKAHILIFDGTSDPEMALQFGITVLLDKPLILSVLKGTKIPRKMRLIADRIIEVDGPKDPTLQPKFEQAFRELFPGLRNLT